MRLILSVVIFFAAKAICFEVKSVKGIKGHIKSIKFDSNFNCYVVANLSYGDCRFYKIDSEKNISLEQEFKNIEKVIINRKNDVYVFERFEIRKILERRDYNPADRTNDHRTTEHYYDDHYLWNIQTTTLSTTTTSTTQPPEVTSTKNLIWIMKESAQKLTKLYSWEGGEKPKSFLDKDDYLFVSTEYGLIAFQPGQNVPMAVIDKKHKPFDSFANDRGGNVYVNTGSSVFVVSKGRSNSWLRLSAREWNLLGRSNPEYITVNSMASDRDGKVYFATKSQGSSPKANLTIIYRPYDQFSAVYSQFQTSFDFLYFVKNRFYVTSVISEEYFSIFFLEDKDGKPNQIGAIEELFEYPLITNDENLLASDSSGNVFFAHNNTVLRIKQNETSVTRIYTPLMRKISSIVVDKNDDLWVLAVDLYFYKNGTTDAIWVANVPGEEDSPMKENKKTGEIYVGSGTGLSVYKNDK